MAASIFNVEGFDPADRFTPIKHLATFVEIRFLRWKRILVNRQLLLACRRNLHQKPQPANRRPLLRHFLIGAQDVVSGKHQAAHGV